MGAAPQPPAPVQSVAGLVGAPSGLQISQALASVTSRAPTPNDDVVSNHVVGQFWNLPGVNLWQSQRSTAGQAAWFPVPVSSNFPLDAVPTPIAAYGMRKLRSAYSGSCFDVTRASDSASLTVGFLSNGDLDTGSLDAFLIGTTGRITKWCDQSGNGFDATQATALLQPTLSPQNTIGGNRTIVYDSITNGSGTTGRALAMPSGVTASTQAISVVMLGRSTSAIRSGNGIQLTGSPNSLTYCLSEGSDAWVIRKGGATGSVSALPKPPISPFIYGFTCDGTACHEFADDVMVTAGSSVSGTVAGGFIGYMPDLGQLFGYAEMGAVIIYARTLSATELPAVQASLYQAFKVQPQRRDTVVLDGDSLTEGRNTVNAQTYARKLETLLPPNVKIYATGWSANTAVNQLALFPNSAAKCYQASAKNNIFSLFAGTNDLLANATGASIIATFQAYSALVRALGSNVKFVVVTSLPRAQFMPAGNPNAQYAQQTILNTWLQQNWQTIADGIVDLRSDPTIGVDAAVNNTLLYNSDGVHLTDLGYSYAAQLFAKTINGLLT